MGDRFAIIDMGENWGLCPFREEKLGLHLTMWPDPSGRFATINMSRKVGSCAPLWGEMGPHRTQSRLGLAPDMGRKLGAIYSFWGGAGSQSNTVWPSGIFIHPAVWPQQTWAEKWGLLWPFWGRGSWVPIEHNVVLAESCLRTN